MNRVYDDDSSSSLELYREPKVADIPDLINMIADFCDDAALSKLSRVTILLIIILIIQTSKDVRKMIIEESKDRYIRVLEYKYMRVCLQMEVSPIKLLLIDNYDCRLCFKSCIMEKSSTSRCLDAVRKSKRVVTRCLCIDDSYSINIHIWHSKVIRHWAKTWKTWKVRECPRLHSRRRKRETTMAGIPWSKI
jgi:hypothetical protein